MNKGILVVVSGFSGAGKGTVMKSLLENYDNYALSVSVTTRRPRQGEEDGREYFFRTKEEFENLIKEDALIEYAQYVGNYYGTPRSYVEKNAGRGEGCHSGNRNPGCHENKRKDSGCAAGICGAAFGGRAEEPS